MTIRKYKYTVKKEDEKYTLKNLLRSKFEFSSRMRAKIKHDKLLFLNDDPVPAWISAQEGDVISVNVPLDRSCFEPEDIPLDIIYEDEDLLILNKQPGIICHPTKGHPAHTMANGIMKYMNDSHQSFKIRFVNRLDTDTSGILVIGKTLQAQTGLMKQPGRTEKIYTAVVTGRIDNEEGIIDLPIGKLSPDKVKRGIVSEDHGGRASISMYKVTDRYSVTTVNGSKRSFTLVEVNITTGRTHQIRVHMSNTGHPVLGDHLYGEENPNLISRQALHASRLTFRHPVTHEKISITAPLPEDMQRLIGILKNNSVK